MRGGIQSHDNTTCIQSHDNTTCNRSHVTQHAIGHTSHNMQSVTCHTPCNRSHDNTTCNRSHDNTTCIQSHDNTTYNRSHVTQHAFSHTTTYHAFSHTTTQHAFSHTTYRNHIDTHSKHIANTSIHDILLTCPYTFFHLLSFFKHIKREKFNINNQHHYNLSHT